MGVPFLGRGWRRKVRQSPSGLASSASSPVRGAFLRGQSPREKPPLTGEVAAEQAGRALDVSGGGKFAVSVVGGGVLDAPRRGQDPSLRTDMNRWWTRGAREGGSPPLPSWRVAARKRGATVGCGRHICRPYRATVIGIGGSGEHPTQRWRKGRGR